MEEDKELKEAIEECARIVNRKCGRKPFMIVITKADLKFESQEQRRKGIASGTATFMYMSRPPLKRSGLSKLMIDTARHALSEAERKALAD